MHKRREVWVKLLDKEKSFRFVSVMRDLPIEQYVNEIYGGHSNDKEKTHACSDIYVNCCPESSWEHLASQLYKQDEMTAVDQARPFLPPRGT